MKHSTRLIVCITLASLLGACASQPAYREAEGSGYGYTEQQRSPDQYRITFKARGDDTARAMDYALLRASELAMTEGFDWFAVTDRQTLVDRERIPDRTEVGTGIGYESVQACGLLTCRSYRRPVQTFQTNVTLGDSRSEVEVNLEVRLGRGMRPSTGESFDAREVNENLKPEA